MTMTEDKEKVSTERQFINEVWERIEGDRGAIATLSRCLNRQSYYQRQAAQYIYPYLPDKIRRYPSVVDRYVFVAALMAANYMPDAQRDESGRNFGTVCSNLKEAIRKKSGIKPDDKKTNGIDRRFQALLNADGEEVYRYIEMLAPLLRQHQVPCDWAKLLEDLNWWDHENESVRLRWARDYYTT